MTFEEYLISKKIDSVAFKNGNPNQWNHFNEVFQTMHSNSFTMQKLNLINSIRRKYPLSADNQQKILKPKPMRPVIRPKKQ